MQQQLENLTEADNGETEDDTYLQELEQFRKNPVNLNTADINELKQLRVLTDLQIHSLISYRRLFGNFISIYELQAVPSWDVSLVKKLLPFITVSTAFSLAKETAHRLRDGEHTLLLRLSQVLERSAGFKQSNTGAGYLGSPLRIFFRYTYNFKNQLQYGMVGDKDAGEQFFRGQQQTGFDFYSLHLFARKLGSVQSLAIGDFTVNMGQGLIQWQSLAFKKSADVLGIKRQSAVLRPNSAAGEFYFHRGAGITFKRGRLASTVFFSVRKLSANFIADTGSRFAYVSSFLTAGYHRTVAENADRNKLGQRTAGVNVSYTDTRWHIGINGVYYHFSSPVQKRDEPYNLFAISGTNWYNISADYSYTYRNFHFFGEAAVDRHFNKAFINGLLISVDPKIDVSVLHRSISQAYQAVNGNAFTESTYPSNESGIYTGLSIRPVAGWKVDMYADIYKFPWLKYQADAPGYGRDYLIQVTCSPNKQVEIISRIRSEQKQSNQTGNNTVTNFLSDISRINWRTQVSYKLNTAVTWRNRAELLWYEQGGKNKEKGFLTFFDLLYKPLLSPWGGGLRLQYFETDGYNSRMYAYENDVLYSYSIPAFYDKGFRYYLNLSIDAGKKTTCWVRWSQALYPGKTSIGSDTDEINGNKRSELKLQLRYVF